MTQYSTHLSISKCECDQHQVDEKDERQSEQDVDLGGAFVSDAIFADTLCIWRLNLANERHTELLHVHGSPLLTALSTAAIEYSTVPVIGCHRAVCSEVEYRRLPTSFIANRIGVHQSDCEQTDEQ